MTEGSPFDAVPPPLRTALERRGFATLTKVQQAVVDSDLTGRDLRISSQTGSGKTVAVGLAVATALVDRQDQTAAPAEPAPAAATALRAEDSAFAVDDDPAALAADDQASATEDPASAVDPASPVDGDSAHVGAEDPASAADAPASAAAAAPQEPAPEADADADTVAADRDEPAPARTRPQSSPGHGPRVLMLTPTRELASQVRAELASLYADLPHVSVVSVTGGTDPVRERRALSKHPAVLIATPGRLLDHLRAGAVNLSRVQHAVLDEADQMLDLGFRDELEAVLEQLPSTRRLHMVSATFARGVLRFADQYQQDILHLEGTRLGAANEDIEHVAHLVLADQRHGALVNLLLAERDSGSWLVFVRRRIDTTDLAERLVEDGFSAMPFSGDLSQAQRDRTLAAFRRGLVRVLVATDVAARGIDVQDISTVVHYDLPNDRETFTHRSGRTGRAGQKGRSLLLVPPSAERRTRRLLRENRIDADWQAVPDARRIEKANVKRTRRALHARLDAAEEIVAKQLDYATSLLENHDPATVVAILLDMAKSELPREPVMVRHLEPRGDDAPDPGRPRGRGRRPGGRSGDTGRAYGRGRPRGRTSFKRRGSEL